MISPRGCSKSSAFIHGVTRYYCMTHNHDMANEQYQCSLGQVEAYICQQVSSETSRLQARVAKIEEHFTARLIEFGRNLEKLHEQPNPPT